jgi:DNA mismatch repair protein MutL
MPRIRQLPPLVVNQIAAGEVVERPASVLKELLENSLDAGATRIDVEVQRGGTGLVRVVDDGGGIPAEDLLLALASHATSKLGRAEDLAGVATFGFRGEALAAVASVAQVTLQSRPPGQPHGAEVTCAGGRVSGPRAWNGAPGTRVEVRNLFYNTPARRKFLRGAGTEMGHVREAFLRVALARHGLHATLRHNGRSVYEVPGALGLLDRIGLFFGPEVAGSLYLLHAGRGPVVLDGYVGDPSLERGGPELQYLFVNDRWVRDRGLFQAVQEAYRGLLMAGRYPTAFLFLELPPGEVDVNVHPAKAEVRFRDREALYQLVRQAVRARLEQADLTARMQLKTHKERLPAAAVRTEPPLPGEKEQPAARALEGPSPAPRPVAMPAAARSTPAAPAPAAPDPAAAAVAGAGSGAGLFAPAQDNASPSPQPDSRADEKGPVLHSGSGPLRAIQVLDCYLVVEASADEVLFLDQHALHERLLFEDLRQRTQAGALESQRLLVPEPVSLPPAQAAAVLEHREALAGLGLAVEDFGGGTVLLTAYPALLDRRPPREVFQAVADHLAGRGRAPDREQLVHELLGLMACHAAVRAGDRLTPEEVAALVARMDLAEDAHHCPHGRPTVLRLSRRDLERHFRRR